MRKQFPVTVMMLITLLLLGQSLSGQKAKNQVRLVTKEASLGKALPGIVEESLVASPDRNSVAYATTRLNKGKTALVTVLTVMLMGRGPAGGWGSLGKAKVVVDGVAGKEYSNVSTPVFSADSKRVAYSAGRHVVIDGVEGKSYPEKGVTQEYNVGDPLFSPDSKRVAYVALSNHHFASKPRIVLDGLEGKIYDEIDSLLFSPDSRHLMYVVKRNGKWVTIVDDVEGQEYEELRGAIFSPDSNRVAYAAKRKGKWRVVVEGADTQDKEYDDVGLGSRFVALNSDIDSVEYKGYDSVQIEGPVDNVELLSAWGPLFSPDGQRMAYPAKRNGKWVMVVDGAEGREYERVWSPVFSPDSKHVVYKAKQKGKWRIVSDGVEGKEYDQIWNPTYSPNGQRMAYTARRGDKWVVVVDGVEGAGYERTWGIVFSPDSRRVAYKSKRGGKWHIVVDDVESQGAGHDELELSAAAFSPDSQHFAYIAKRGGKWVVMVDGVEGKEYDALLRSKLIFDGSRVIKTIAVRKMELFHVEIEIGEE